MNLKRIGRLICVIFCIVIIIVFVGEKYDISNTYTVIENENYNYKVIIRQYNGKIILSEEYYHLWPIVQEVGKDILTLTLGNGDCWLTRFINVKDGNVSEQFENILTYSSDKVVYPKYEDGVMKIIVQDIFDKERCYYEVLRDYAPDAVGKYMVIDATFLDETTLHLQYYSGEDWEEVSEVIHL